MVVSKVTGKFVKELRDIWGIDSIRPHKLTRDEVKEEQGIDELESFTSENMLRLVKLAMPNIVRNKLVSVQPMQSPQKDTIYYIKPSWQSSNNSSIAKTVVHESKKDSPSKLSKIWKYTKH